ncbi:hypothetical protein ACOME3_004878 [Neoechinorhynchus agilis]
MISKNIKIVKIPDTLNKDLLRTSNALQPSAYSISPNDMNSIDKRGSGCSVRSSFRRSEPTAFLEFDDSDDMSECRRIVINVGGVRHETNKETLLRHPNTPLAELARQHTDSRVEYFIDRHPTVFSSVLNYYRSNELHVPLDICGALMRRELEYWGISEDLIEPCCWTSYSAFKEAQRTLADLDLDIEFNADRPDPMLEIPENEGKLASFRRKLWYMLEEPYSSNTAKIFTFVTFGFIIASISGMILETHDYFKVNDTRYPYNHTKPNPFANVSSAVQNRSQIVVKRPHPALEYLDYACTLYFSIEFLTRFSVSYDKKQFWKSALNIIDFVSLMPLYLVILLDLFIFRNPGETLKSHSHMHAASLLKVVLILRVVRVLRLFKLMKQYTALKILVYAVKASFKELLMLAIFMVLFVIFFATFIYHVERDRRITSIPMGAWWAIITMTTVGYGDVYPETGLGYVCGALCGVCGVLVVALTIPIISNNFTLFYSHAQSRSKLNRTQRRLFIKKQKERQFRRRLLRQDRRPTDLNRKDSNNSQALKIVVSEDSNV